MTPDDVADRHHLAADEEAPAPSHDVVGALVFTLALVLLALVPFATHPAPIAKGWFTEPRNAPILGLLIMAAAGSVFAFRLIAGLANPANRPSYTAYAGMAFAGIATALEYSLYFVVYLVVLGFAGFALSTLLFGQFCIWRAGLRSWRWAFANAAFTIVTVLVLRVGLGLWFPQAGMFSLLPPSIGNAIGQYI